MDYNLAHAKYASLKAAHLSALPPKVGPKNPTLGGSA